MSEKITFQELIESIAEETENSQQFTRDFLKNFVDVINNGLERDGKVNVAGFGKFDLRRVDKREGYNPQTEEKMVIPAHNKVVFKPYKDLRELVNAPYAHLEPELIEEKDPSEPESQDSTDSKEADFIPTAPPTSHSETDENSVVEEKNEDPFGFDEYKSSTTSSNFSLEDTDTTEKDEPEETSGDVVEFNRKLVDDDQTSDSGLDEFMGGWDSDEDEKIEEVESSVGGSDDEERQESEIKTEENISLEKPGATPPLDRGRHSGKRAGSSLPLIAAAVVILLLIAGGIWYFNLQPDNFFEQMGSRQMASTSQATTPQDKQPKKVTDQTPRKKAVQNPQKQTSAKKTSSPTSPKSEDLQIKEGQTLWSIAREKYGNPRLWPWIYGTNEPLEDPDVILAGNSLSVPLPTGPQNRLSSSDSVGVAKGFIATYRWYKDNNSSKARNHIWAAQLYHADISNISNIKIDKSDLAYANQGR